MFGVYIYIYIYIHIGHNIFWSISCTEIHALNKVPLPTIMARGEAQGKLVLRGGQSHTARQAKSERFLPPRIPDLLPALVPRIFSKCNYFKVPAYIQ